MGFIKHMQGDKPIIIGNSTEEHKLFRPGFSYRVGDTIYTVKTDCTTEIGSPMREVQLNDGSVEILPVQTIVRDLQEADAFVLEPVQKYLEKKPTVKNEQSSKEKKKPKKRKKKKKKNK